MYVKLCKLSLYITSGTEGEICVEPPLIKLEIIFSIFFYIEKPIVVVRDVCPSIRPSACGNNFFSR